jgi:hypothetical protein
MSWPASRIVVVTVGNPSPGYATPTDRCQRAPKAGQRRNLIRRYSGSRRRWRHRCRGEWPRPAGTRSRTDTIRRRTPPCEIFNGRVKRNNSDVHVAACQPGAAIVELEVGHSGTASRPGRAVRPASLGPWLAADRPARDRSSAARPANARPVYGAPVSFITCPSTSRSHD